MFIKIKRGRKRLKMARDTHIYYRPLAAITANHQQRPQSRITPHNPKAAGSNTAAATNKPPAIGMMAGGLFMGQGSYAIK
jgi:hypothetical protein